MSITTESKRKKAERLTNYFQRRQRLQKIRKRYSLSWYRFPVPMKQSCTIAVFSGSFPTSWTLFFGEVSDECGTEISGT